MHITKILIYSDKGRVGVIKIYGDVGRSIRGEGALSSSAKTSHNKSALFKRCHNFLPTPQYFSSFTPTLFEISKLPLTILDDFIIEVFHKQKGVFEIENIDDKKSF